jgi:hypothetical protein
VGWEREYRKINWIRWVKICLDKKIGGFGVHRVRDLISLYFVSGVGD